jgi:hypothetical protein
MSGITAIGPQRVFVCYPELALQSRLSKVRVKCNWRIPVSGLSANQHPDSGV